MSTNHTPGPWEASGCRVLQAGAMKNWQLVVAIIPTTIDPKPTPDAAADTISQRDANARLIAAAPELLGALKSALRALEDNLSPGPMDEDAKTAARLAIAKATA